MIKKLVFVLLLFAFACKPQADFKPKEINFDRDICELCLMGLADQKYSVQLTNSEGKTIWFDDIGCYVNYKGSDGWKKFIRDGEYKSWIGDCETGKWIDTEKANYRFGDDTPMGYGFGALAEANDSTFDFNTVAQRIKDGKTSRDKFMKEKKMGKMKCGNGKCGGMKKEEKE